MKKIIIYPVYHVGSLFSKEIIDSSEIEKNGKVYLEYYGTKESCEMLKKYLSEPSENTLNNVYRSFIGTNDTFEMFFYACIIFYIFIALELKSKKITFEFIETPIAEDQDSVSKLFSSIKSSVSHSRNYDIVKNLINKFENEDEIVLIVGVNHALDISEMLKRVICDIQIELRVADYIKDKDLFVLNATQYSMAIESILRQYPHIFEIKKSLMYGGFFINFLPSNRDELIKIANNPLLFEVEYDENFEKLSDIFINNLI